MGVRSLNSFVNKIDGLRNRHELKNCGIVIDANNLSKHLFRYNTIVKYGGDYYQFATIVRNFFETLKQCNITPIIIFDGTSHIEFLAQRHRKYVSTHEKVKLLNESRDFNNVQVLPNLITETFIEVMRDMEINDFFQCTFDADIHVAKVANHFKYPLLSNDGDFLLIEIYGGVISCESLEWKNAFELNRDYIECKIYKRIEFTRIFNLKPEMCAIFGSLLGDNNSNCDVFLNFIDSIRGYKKTNVNSNYMNKYHDRMHRLIRWLRSKSSASHAIRDVYDYLKRRDELNLYNNFAKSINRYQLGANYSYLLELICFEGNRNEIINLGFEYYDKEISFLPKWFLYDFHTMNISCSVLMAIITKPCIFFKPQFEDFSLPSSFECCHKLYEIICALMRVSNNHLKPLTVYSRKDFDFYSHTITPNLYLSDGQEVPSLERIRNIEINQRKEFILKIVGLSGEVVRCLKESLIALNTEFVKCLAESVKIDNLETNYLDLIEKEI